MEKMKICFFQIFIIPVLLFSIITSCTIKEVQPPPVAPPLVQPPPKPAKIALVLGAGASKGFAHIGVLKILETNKIPVHMIVGTSVGSVIGSFYAYGLNAFELQKLSFSIEQKDIVDLTIPENGFIKGEKLEEFVNRTLKNTPMEKLKIPFYAIAIEIQNGQETVFGRGNTGQAVRASCSIPGVFRPVKIGDKVYVDGGVVSPVAVDAAKRLGADVVLAVDISASAERTPPRNTIETLLQSIDIMYSKLAATQLAQADVVIRPKVGYIGSSDFSKKHEAVLEGEKATIEVMPRILEIITHLRLEGRLE
ncbi:MAG: patatin-like phospholipase family protein [Deltaproteobacteria bacterium]|nr:patatin-like phospholipase family protein [Deltaproteobacteria bacterium]